MPPRLRIPHLTATGPAIPRLDVFLWGLCEGPLVRNPAGLWAGFTGTHQAYGGCRRTIHGLGIRGPFWRSRSDFQGNTRRSKVGQREVPRALCRAIITVGIPIALGYLGSLRCGRSESGAFWGHSIGIKNCFCTWQ